MRKIVKLFLLVITCLFVFSLTSCGESHADATLVDVDGILFPNSLVLPKTEEGKTFVGYYTFDEESKTGYLYLVGSVIPDGKYEEVYVSGENQVKYSFPSYAHGRDGYYFAGWYLDNTFTNGQRISTSDAVDADKIICAKYITIADAGLIAVVCILIVFGMLALLWGIVSLFKYIPSKQENAQPAKQEVKQPVVQQQKAFTMDDIKDEDMMVAALVATIDYHNETKEDVRVVSVKQIG
jgi:uncharacterized repeat protein (TIGR02543 family)